MAARYYDKRGESDHRQKRNITKANYGRPKTPKPDYYKPADPYPDYGMPVIPRPDYTVKIKNPVNKVPPTRIEDLYAVPNKNKNTRINISKQQPKHSTSSNGSHEPEFLHKLEKSLGAHNEKLSANKRGQLVFTKNGHKSSNQHQSYSGSNHQAASQLHEYDDPHYDIRYRHPENDINWRRGYNGEKIQHFEQNIIQKYDYGPGEYHRNPLDNEYIVEQFANHQYAMEDTQYQEFSPEELALQNLTIDDYEHPPFDDGYNYQGYQNENDHHEYYIDEYGHPYYPADEYGGTNMAIQNIR